MNEKDELIANINASFDIMKKIEILENGILMYSDKRRKARGVGSFILFYIVGAVLGGLLMMVLSNIPFFAYGPMSGLIAFSMFILPILVPILARIMRSKQCENEINKLNAQLTTYKNDPVLYWLPAAYRDSFSFTQIASYIQNMRANNIQEAINLLETEKHQARLELNARYGRRY